MWQAIVKAGLEGSMEDRTQSGGTDLGTDWNDDIQCGYQVQGEQRALETLQMGGTRRQAIW